MDSSFPRLWLAAAAALAVAAALLAACDAVPGPASLNRQPPEVDSLLVVPDTIRAAALPPDSVTDGQAAVTITTAVMARDPDGSVDRVLVLIDPAYGASSAGVAQLLREGNSDRFGGALRFNIAVERADVLMVRAFAVDNDSLTSNEVVARIHLLPDTTHGAD